VLQQSPGKEYTPKRHSGDLVQVQPRSFGDEADYELGVRGRHLAAAREPARDVFSGEEDLEVFDDLPHRINVHAPLAPRAHDEGAICLGVESMS